MEFINQTEAAKFLKCAISTVSINIDTYHLINGSYAIFTLKNKSLLDSPNDLIEKYKLSKNNKKKNY
jgi:hypothetical protein